MIRKIITFIFISVSTLIVNCDSANMQLYSTKVDRTQFYIETLGEGISRFYKDTGRYPTTDEGLDVLQKQPANTPRWNGPYIKRSYSEDVWSVKYVYIFPSKYGNKPYDIYSFGKNRRDDKGLKDDITNWKEVNYEYYKTDYPTTEPIFLLVIMCLLALAIVWIIKTIEKCRKRGKNGVRLDY